MFLPEELWITNISKKLNLQELVKIIQSCKYFKQLLDTEEIWIFPKTEFVQKNLENYLQMERWMRSLGYPETLGEAVSLDPQKDSLLDGARSDGTLLVYNSSFQPIAKIFFRDMFPSALTPVPFSATATDINYIMATATFKYTIFNVESLVENES